MTRIALLFIFSALFLAEVASAHSGRTNANGCHNNRKTGEFHCHSSVAPKRASVSKSNGASGLYFPNCTAASSAGYWNILRGAPEYGEHLDRDQDGIACER